jgi:hypothetical protein
MTRPASTLIRLLAEQIVDEWLLERAQQPELASSPTPAQNPPHASRPVRQILDRQPAANVD